MSGGHGKSKHVDGCRCVRCRGFEKGNTLTLVHGATSERRIRPVAARQRRNVMRQLRLRAGDLSPIGKGYLDAYVRLRAKIELIDDYLGEHGLIREDGSVQPVMGLYVSLQNAARLALGRLEQHLQQNHGPDPLEALMIEGRAIAARTAGNGEDDS